MKVTGSLRLSEGPLLPARLAGRALGGPWRRLPLPLSLPPAASGATVLRVARLRFQGSFSNARLTPGRKLGLRDAAGPGGGSRGRQGWASRDGPQPRD